MEAIVRGMRSCQEALKSAILKGNKVSSRLQCVTSSSPMAMGLENVRVSDVLKTKGEDKVGSWIWCHTNDIVDDAMRNMAQHNIGSLVVLKPGDQQLITGILTERDYMRKIIGQGRSPKYTRVGEIMTDENKLITLPSHASILQAMQLMTDNQIRHLPIIDGKIVGMISIVDVVRAVVEQQNSDIKRLNEFIKGEYY